MGTFACFAASTIVRASASVPAIGFSAAASWVRINDDQHQWGLVLHVTGDPKVYGRVYVGTHGRGTLYGDPARPRQPYDSAVGRWAAAALERAFASGGGAAKPVRIRMMGGTVPTRAIVAPLGTPFVLVPLGNADNNQHSFDENLRMGNFVSGMRTTLGLPLTPFPP